MCGIAAAIHVEKAGMRVKTMLNLMRGRGETNDPTGTMEANVAMGTRRLKILDGENAIQPFWSYDQRFALVMNGEVYNFRELRQMIEPELKKRGYTFCTDSDTEVVVQGIALFGYKFIRHFNGMFALVVYDRKKREYIAARDPLGIKPLYYVKTEEGGICFASEIKPLLAVTQIGQVEIVKPGHIYTPTQTMPYQVIVPDLAVGKDLTENAHLLEKLLKSSVQSQLHHSLSNAVMFSGGIDSTLILHYARQFDPSVKAYHISRLDGRDREFAEIYANETGLDMKIVDFERKEALGLVESVIEATESFEPNMIRSGVFSYLLAREISNDNYKVALCGEGADELFCGYAEMKTLEDPLAQRKSFLKDLHKTQLQRTDRTSMQFNLEVRVPFLDAKIISLAMKLPKNQLLNKYEGELKEKLILRKLYEFDSKLPKLIKLRSKVVFIDGAGMGDNSESSPFFDFGRVMLSPKDYLYLSKKYKRFNVQTYEEVYYLSILEKSLELDRLNFLAQRPTVNKKSI